MHGYDAEVGHGATFQKTDFTFCPTLSIDGATLTIRYKNGIRTNKTIITAYTNKIKGMATVHLPRVVEESHISLYIMLIHHPVACL